MKERKREIHTYIYFFNIIYIYIYNSRFPEMILPYVSSCSLQADQKRRLEEEKRHDALMASLSALTPKPAPPPVTENTPENQQLKDMLQEALSKMNKMEKEMQALKRDSDAENGDDDDDDMSAQEGDAEELLTTQDGETAPS